MDSRIADWAVCHGQPRQQLSDAQSDNRSLGGETGRIDYLSLLMVNKSPEQCRAGQWGLKVEYYTTLKLFSVNNAVKIRYVLPFKKW